MVKKQSWLETYYAEIQAGRIIVGHELKDELKRLIKDLENPKYIYDTTKADLIIDFMENCIKLTKSPFYGKPMILMLWQKALIEAAYSFKFADNGRERFKKIVLLIARKNTKSETCSALGLTEAITGAPGADIVCSSNDFNQAAILYDAIDTMRLMIDPKEQDTHKNQRFISVKENGSKIFTLTDRTRNKEGRNIDFAIIDEVHEMKDNVILKSIEQSQSLKENPKLWIITTEGFVNDGVLDDLLKDCRKIISGEDESISAERVLPWLYTQDSEQEVWRDRNSWYKSNPTLGIVKRWDYLEEQVDEARKSKASRMFVLSKDFNFKQSNSQAWLQESDYKYAAKYDLEEFRNSIILGAVDLAETTDLTAAKILLLRPEDKTKYVHSMYFIPESKLESSDDKQAGAKYAEWAREGLLTVCEGNDVDLTIVADWFYKLYEQYGLRLYKCGYDVKFSKEFLKRMDAYGFETEIVLQNKLTLSDPTKLVEADLKGKLINYNENPIDRWCLGNSALEIDNAGNVQIVKTKGQAARRIDGAVTLAILYEMYRRYRSDLVRSM